MAAIRSQKMTELGKARTGIDGFDTLSGGGLPRGRTTLLVGGPGAGKTIFALQTLVNGARHDGEAGIFVAFEESSQQIIANVAPFGWDLPDLEKKQLFFLNAQLSPTVVRAGEFDLTGLLATLSIKARAMQAKRIVFDGLDVLLTLLDDPIAEQREIYRLNEWLRESGLVGILTAKAGNESGSVLAHYDFMQFMVDCMVVMEHFYVNQTSLRRIHIHKYRGSAALMNEFPYVISPTGIDIPSLNETQQTSQVSNDRVSSGIQRLDHMLGGGYYRGTSVLLTGAPGTAKTTLAGCFIQAALRRGERALYMNFDEDAVEIVRNLTSVNIQLQPYVKSGQLKMASARSNTLSADKHVMSLEQMVRDHQPTSVVVDPLSALGKLGRNTITVGVVEQLLRFLKSRGITMFGTSLLSGSSPEIEQTDLQVSTIADVWIHLSYLVRGGERNRALTIIKARGIGHSNQVRELLLSDEGVELADVYTAGGEVLMGTARWEKELAEKAEQDRHADQLIEKRRELTLLTEDIGARIGMLERELKGKQTELDALILEHDVHDKARQADHTTLERLRHGQADLPGHKPKRAPTKTRSVRKSRKGG